jgi:hypothetical protein
MFYLGFFGFVYQPPDFTGSFMQLWRLT